MQNIDDRYNMNYVVNYLVQNKINIEKIYLKAIMFILTIYQC